MTKKISMDLVAEEIQNELQTYSDQLTEEVEEKIQTIANECKKNVAEKSPKKTGKYAKGWAITKEKKRLFTVYTIYNKNEPSLTHLLENGHIIRNKKDGKTYGRSKAFPHIEPAEKEAIKEMEGILK